MFIDIKSLWYETPQWSTFLMRKYQINVSLLHRKIILFMENLQYYPNIKEPLRLWFKSESKCYIVTMMQKIKLNPPYSLMQQVISWRFHNKSSQISISIAIIWTYEKVKICLFRLWIIWLIAYCLYIIDYLKEHCNIFNIIL